jgi:hypothetical protein
LFGRYVLGCAQMVFQSFAFHGFLVLGGVCVYSWGVRAFSCGAAACCVACGRGGRCARLRRCVRSGAASWLHTCGLLLFCFSCFWKVSARTRGAWVRNYLFGSSACWWWRFPGRRAGVCDPKRTDKPNHAARPIRAPPAGAPPTPKSRTVHERAPAPYEHAPTLPTTQLNIKMI